MSWLRENWRVAFLVVLLLGSSVALFAPGIGASASGDEEAASRPTNLQYGLELSGGVRLRATAVGVTASGVDVPGDETERNALEADVANALSLEPGSVTARDRTSSDNPDVVEVYSNNTTAEVGAAFDELGLAYESLDSGVTEATRDEIADTISTKIDATGFSGARAYPTTTQSGQSYIVVEVPGQNASEVRSLIQGRGEVEMRAYYPEGGNQTNATVLTHSQLQRSDVSTAQMIDGRPSVPVSLTQDIAETFAADMREYGFTSGQGVSNCEFPDGGYCLLTVLDGEVVYDAGVRANLAQSFENGEFVQDPRFVITANSMEEARELRVNLQAGALPTQLEFQDSYYVSPSFAERYKPLSLVTGLAAAIAMALVVFARYGDPRVAIPMVFTALSEVVILLGFAAVSGLALDLSHIAGFIAVIGTGVDDLVIIADEVMTQEVGSQRVFKSRFRKALWVIGAAAVTTIIAMSPLAVLSLGDLRGFAIVTILGVLIGVLVTRPAYGDILRRLLTGEH
ncbi:protein-export membrane protein SecD [Halobacterium hubeiense]|uniref:Protein-export membrane protein SecD n=2 Tax=Halobacterium TaxID=2239 RepID=A0A0U5H2U5_9EURY|nr:preprotein translocase subunit SecD [Halobacterium hubeiense]CQH60774.1 protein-export membrane protein SecD [Halobacterium hubeiense]